MTQLLQIMGAVLLLSAFAAAQWGAVKDTSVVYLAVNTVAAADLAILALMSRDWGFTLLEGTWAAISFIGVVRHAISARTTNGRQARLSAFRARSTPASSTSARREPPPGPAQHRRRRRTPPGPTKLLLEQRTVRLTGDELAGPGRLARLFRDSYTASQGRQWMQAHVLWWIVTFLRGHGVRPDWDVLSAPHVARTVTTMALPPGHTRVHPRDQVPRNFGLWWPILVELTRAAYQRRWLRWWPGRDVTLPRTGELENRASQLGLRPWMSSATVEELAGIGKALVVVEKECRRGRLDAEGFMLRVLLPELLIVELYWLHTPEGRPREGNRAKVDVMLRRQYEQARTKYAAGKPLTPLNYLYLQAGDILEQVSALQEESPNPYVRRVVELYRELQATVNAMPEHALSEDGGTLQVASNGTTKHGRDLQRPRNMPKTLIMN